MKEAILPDRRTMLIAAAVAAATSPLSSTDTKAQTPANPLLSWNDGPAKQAILDFVARVTKKGGDDYVPPEQRIATFDNDGTLWCEQPMYFQLAFALDRVAALAPQHPAWKTTQPFKAALEHDMAALNATGEKGVIEIVEATHSGMTTDEFTKLVADWIATARHPRFKRPYNELIYQPMVELLGYLRANGFKTFIVSGGGIDFMRPWVEQALRHTARAGGRLVRRHPFADGCEWQTRVDERAKDRVRKRWPRQTGWYQSLHRSPADFCIRQFRR